MTRTVIDVDDEMLAEAAKIFGTATKAATVNAALEDAVKRRKRTSFLGWLAEGGLPDLTAPTTTQPPPETSPPAPPRPPTTESAGRP
ncbi:type II toxin-antitoxin system VapB family antitoxin [Streptomyces sp. ME02-8801-2C]|uniref:type II toxin-antitoxin system VapB family antitoxin n=1 Tax=Streptomyces sp. ME02-8801-2C TaxID=3028680 RepID=UPI0029AB2BAD|nr:type II toxin-antitoxin system VapB family antitoxin [Streptomyces sp. ME02-8801-2C]MDX3453188.1 type II toxin-antitoxin system VapB family antitoxin [Streptomyces sp. ME02-8801-2C]